MSMRQFPIDVLIDRSSFGEPAVAKLRSRTPWKRTAAIANRAEELFVARDRRSRPTYEQSEKAETDSRFGTHSSEVTLWSSPLIRKNRNTTTSPNIQGTQNILNVLNRLSDLLVHRTLQSHRQAVASGDQMKLWWERWPGRLEAEQQAFQKRGLDFKVDRKAWSDGRFILRGLAPLSDTDSTELVVIFPDTFPHTRFTILAPKLSLSRHQAPFGGSLCVFPRDSEHWRPEFLAADVIKDRVPDLVRLVRGSPDELREQEEPQGEPASAFYTYWQAGCIVVPNAALSLPKAKGSLAGTFRLLHDGTGWLEALWAGNGLQAPLGKALLKEVRNQAGETVAKAQPQLIQAFAGPEWTMPWLRLEQPPTGQTCDEVVALLDRRIPVRKDMQKAGNLWIHLAGFVFEEELRQGLFGDAWIFLVRVQKSRDDPPKAALLRGLRFGSEDLSARIPELKVLPQTTVAVLGLGALGSPIAIDMARAQVGRLRLADFDYVDPAAGVRWIGGLEFAGALKTRALQTLISRNYPFTTTEALLLRLGEGSLEVRSEFREAKQVDLLLDGLDLLIDATADDNATRAIGAAAIAAHKIHLVVWGVDGFGGVVARLRPGKTGCYHCLSMALSGGTIVPPPSAPTGAVRVQPRGCADPTFTASTPDLLPIAVQATRLAFSTLSEGVTGGYPGIAQDVFVLKMRSSSGEMLGAPEWRAYSLPRNPECTFCREVQGPS
jgi:molybdopterin/thiamine biosynthesis adenylyltransferase